MIGNQFCIQIIFKNMFFNNKYTFTIYVGRVWVVIGNFLLEKQTFNELLKAIGIQQYIYFISLKISKFSLSLSNKVKI